MVEVYILLNNSSPGGLNFKSEIRVESISGVENISCFGSFSLRQV